MAETRTTGAQRFEAAWREACANHENVADAIGRLLDEQGTRLARVEALLAEGPDTWTPYDSRDTGETFLAESVLDFVAALRAALAPEAEGATS